MDGLTQLTLNKLDALTRAEPLTIFALTILVVAAIIFILHKVLQSITNSQKEFIEVNESTIHHYTYTINTISERKETIESEFESLKVKLLEIQSNFAKPNKPTEITEKEPNDLASHTHRATQSLVIVNYAVKSTQLIGAIRETGLLVIKLAEASKIPATADVIEIIIKLNSIEKDIRLYLTEMENCFAITDFSLRLNNPSEILLKLPSIIDTYSKEIYSYDLAIQENFNAITSQAAPRALRV
ncbi:hypothetical protein [Pseudomonas sp. 2FE]|uniref:hypothetical protein n=1 Tax=Pseudomonas sp. 2FE TaxID=2502190 RepID=UPI0010F89DAE|nr:hypothetical protein [Pseudomonas sp. 2FE]